jgi:acyl dehydratase
MKTYPGLPGPGAPQLGAPMALADFMARAGADLGASGWLTVDQDMIDAFAQLTGDLQFIHVDPVRAAAEGPFGGTVAHGFLTLSLLPRLAMDVIRPVEGIAAKVNYGFDKIRFLAPVPAGARIRGHFLRDKVEERTPGRLSILTTVTLEIEGASRPGLSAQWLSMWTLAEATA